MKMDTDPEKRRTLAHRLRRRAGFIDTCPDTAHKAARPTLRVSSMPIRGIHSL